jgi:hypothetical protein
MEIKRLRGEGIEEREEPKSQMLSSTTTRIEVSFMRFDRILFCQRQKEMKKTLFNKREKHQTPRLHLKPFLVV